ncbi:amidase domain-containing protein [Humibacter sp.]|jgi:hypothetical protein|uniref:amidase domain-containing protein n=1 Tax=Humibacter sp. TaxID=1940291 RepID=UPI002CBA2833|nr:amidase domain-containing protein [Humibacter sp.]HVX07047.1 amidase domain-containing protein [Humibacter sp.]
MTPSPLHSHQQAVLRHRRFALLSFVLCALAAAVLALSGCANATPRTSVPVGFSHTDAAALPAAVQAQLRYVDEHWNSYNTQQYGDMNSLGGDCANFVSQTLIARGWPMTSAWHNYGAGKDRTLSWGYVPSMDSYFAENRNQLGLEELDLNDRAAVAVGDIAMFSWGDGSMDHVMVVTGIDHDQRDGVDHVEVYLSGHNLDELDVSLDDILARNPGTSGHFWHLQR